MIECWLEEGLFGLEVLAGCKIGQKLWVQREVADWGVSTYIGGSGSIHVLAQGLTS